MTGLPDSAAPGEPELAPGEIRERAASGAATLGARGIVVMALGIAVNVFLARRLGPAGFGIVALGTTMVMLGQFLSAGLGAALIRRDSPPREDELGSALGYQLLGAAGLTIISFAAGAAIGEDGLLIAVMVLAVPLTVLRLPAYVTLERRLSYGVIAAVDVAEALLFYLWAVVSVLAGAGVWGFATAVVARALAGTLLMAKLGPRGFIRPRLDWRLTRPIMRFGLQYQAATAGGVARDQGLNLGIAAIAGISSLGVWSLANRILQVPLLGMRTLLRVSYPAMSRLVGGGGDPAAAMENGVAVISTGTAILLVLIAGAAPAGLPALVGDEWEGAPAILVFAALGLMVSIPVTTVSIGYLFAVGRAGLVALAAGCEAVVLAAVALPLLPVIGVESAGIGWVAVGLVDVLMLGRVAAQATGARIFRSIAVPSMIAIGAGAAAVSFSVSGSPSLWRAAAASALGLGLLAAGLVALQRENLLRTLRLARGGLRDIIPRTGGEGARAPGG